MHRRGPLPSFVLAFVVAAAWAVLNGAPAPASTAAVAAPALTAQAEPPPGGTPTTPDSSAVSRDSVSTAPPNSVSGARADSTAVATPDSASTGAPDSSAIGTKAVPKQSVLPDTLEFLPPPGSQTGVEPKAGGGVGPPAPPPKQRVGLFGLTPIVILIGIAALHYFVIKAVAN